MYESARQEFIRNLYAGTATPDQADTLADLARAKAERATNSEQRRHWQALTRHWRAEARRLAGQQ